MSTPAGPTPDPYVEGGTEVRRRALVGIVSVGLRGVGIRLFGLAGYLVTARLLTPEDFGLAALGLTVTFAAHFLADTGIGAALIRHPEDPERRDYSAVVGLQTVVLGVVTLGLLGWALLSGSRTALVTTLFVASLPLLAFRLPAMISLERELRFGPSVRADLSEVFVFNVWIVGGALSGWGVYALATGAIVKTIVGTVVLNRLAPIGWVRPTIDPSRVRRLMSFGLTFQAASAVGLVREQIINIGTTAVAGFGVLGLWSIAGRVTSVPLLVFESLMRVSFPTMARLQGLGEELAELMERQTRRSTVLSGLVLAPSAVAATVVLPILLGSQWDKATIVLPFVFFGIMVSQPVSVIATGYLLAAGDARAVLRTSIAVMVTQVTVTAATLPTLGYIGMGLGHLTSALADGVVLSRAVHKHNGARLLRGVIPGALAFVPAIGIGLLVAGDESRLLLGGLGTVLAPAIFTAIIWLVDRDAMTGLITLIRGLPQRMRRPPEPVPEAPLTATDA